MVKQIRKSYQSDISDKEWQIIEPHIPKPKTIHEHYITPSIKDLKLVSEKIPL
ncbi:Uncharacterised protein [uncultured archaeon]|nr:Uncharacterised protein [uncultured archaeon]